MNLKDLFAKAENGVFTYDQFSKALEEAGIKLADLAEGNYVAKQKYTDELASRDTRITTLNDTITQRDNDLAALRTQLEAAGTDNAKLNQLSTDFADLQKKYEKDTKAYQKQLKDQEYQFAVNEYVSGLKFTSQAAKRDFTKQLIGKGLTVDNGHIIGVTDFMNAYKTENEDAFVVENPNPVPADPKPQFVSPTGGKNDGGATPNPISFSFIGVRPHD